MSEFSWQSGHDAGAASAGANSLFFRLHLDGLQQLGTDLPALFARWGVPADALENMPDRVPRAFSDRFWEAAEEVTSDAFIGLRLAHLARPEVDELVRSIIGDSTSLGAALTQLSSYGQMIDERLDFRLEVEGDEVVMVQQPNPATAAVRHSTECILGVLGLIGRQLTGELLRPRAAYFRHAPPSSIGSLCEHFGDRLHFGGLHNALVFSREYLSLPVVVLTEEDRLRLRREADALLRALPDDPFIAKVRGALGLGLSAGTPSSRQVADMVGVSEQVLRARLRSRGTSLRLLLDSVRRQLALEYLQARELSIGEVATRLGFPSSSAFGRAFRRWAGCTPKEFQIMH